jgi:hypothetical protein
VYELEGSVTGVVHLDYNLGEHTYLYKFKDRISLEYTQEYPSNILGLNISRICYNISRICLSISVEYTQD